MSMQHEFTGMAGAFAGVRVVDFTQDIAGPSAAMLLGDHGAEVIKVEPPQGDVGRARAGFSCWSRNKLGVTLDLERAADRTLAQRLLASADVALFDRPSSELVAMQLDAGACHERNPALLHATVGGWGAPGPWSALPDDETLLLALNGAAFGQFSYDDVPVHLVTPLFRYATGMLAASAIAAALYERECSGLGQVLEVNNLHASAACLGTSAERAGSTDRARPIGSLGTGPNYKLYRCADGEWLFLATLLPHQFELALQAVGLHAEILAMDGVNGTLRNAMLRGVGGRVRTRLEQCFAQRPRSVWLELLHAHDVPAAPCGSRDRWLESEQVAANDLRVSLPHPELGPVEMPGLALEFSATPGRVRHLLRPTDVESLLRTPSTPERRPAARAERPAAGPLHGVEVLDLGTVISTPFAAAILRSFGASVIKLESTSGDAYAGGPGYLGYNRDKRSLALDLKSAAAPRLLQRLVQRADVVCDNFRAGVLARLGLDHARLAALHPRVISASVTAFGERGPLSDRPGFDPLLQAMSGLMVAQGADEPVFHQIPINDVASGLMLSFGIGAALFARERTGQGQRVTTSLAAVSCALQSGELTRFAGRPPDPRGMRDCPGLGALRRFYACADGHWIALACASTQHVERLYGALGVAAWGLQWPPEQALHAPPDAAVAEHIASELRRIPSHELLERLAAAHVPAARAVRPIDLLESPIHAANQYFEFVKRSGAETAFPTATRYARFSATPGGYRGRDPQCGEHSREILRELGCADAEIDALVAARQCREVRR